MRRTGRAVWFLALIFLIYTALADAQQPKKIAQIRFVSVSGDPKTPGRNIEAFRQELRDLGYEEGKNVLLSIATPLHYLEIRAQNPDLEELFKLRSRPASTHLS